MSEAGSPDVGVPVGADALSSGRRVPTGSVQAVNKTEVGRDEILMARSWMSSRHVGVSEDNRTV